jgi:integrase
MAKKRSNNEGTIHRRSNGSWRAQVTLDGRRLSYTSRTKADCQKWIRKTLNQIDEGMTYASTKISLEEYLTEWLVSKKASIKPRSWDHYEHLVGHYITPRLGHIRIRDLQPQHIQGFYNQMQQQEIGAYTIRKIHFALHSALSHALKLNLIRYNPASVVIKPKKPSREMVILDESQISQMLIAAKDTRLEPILHLAVSTGMRQMELLGLKWADLDPIKNTIKVERQLVRPVAGKIEFTSPKTKFGRRTIALGTKAMEVLRRHYERQNITKLAAGDMWTENGLIFTNATGGPLHHRNLLRDFKKLLYDAGLPTIRFHDLRHTAASLMLNHDIPVLVVSRMLGHSRPSITLDVYGHLIPSAQAYVAEKMDELITPIEVTNCTRLHRVAPDFYPQPDL